MGSLWEPYGKGVPFLGAPGNSLELRAGSPENTKKHGKGETRSLPETNTKAST